MDKLTTLLVDDDEDAVLSLSRALSSSQLNCSLIGATTVEKAKELALSEQPSVAVIDLSIDERVGPQSGFDLLVFLRKALPDCRVLVLTGNSSNEMGAKAVKLGASSFLGKPPDVVHLHSLISDGLRHAELKRQYNSLLEDKEIVPLLSQIVGESEAVIALREEIQYVARNSQPVLLIGETGTGKSLCAEIVHKLSNRQQGRFVTFQSTFASNDLCNSELFGVVKGAFTGATENRSGLIEQANGGTLFLDEVNSLPHETQATLLRSLQEKTIRPVGGTKEKEVDFRLVSATNEDPKKLLETGLLRQDFYHRCAHTTIKIPSLRERLSDLDQLVPIILEKLSRSEDAGAVREADSDALATLKTHDWPGNIRELIAVVEAAAYRASDDNRVYLTKHDLRIDGRKVTSSSEPNGPACVRPLKERLDEYREKLAYEAIEAAGGNKVKAAKMLGIGRTTLKRIIGQAE